jgi:hypothetical protein
VTLDGGTLEAAAYDLVWLHCGDLEGVIREASPKRSPSTA